MTLPAFPSWFSSVIHPVSMVCALALGAGLCAESPARAEAQEAPTATPPPAGAEGKPAAPGPSRVVKRGVLERTAEFDVVVEAMRMRPVAVGTRVWTELSVVEAAPHGARVRQGDVLVRFDTRKVREQIEDLERETPVAAASLEQAELEYDNLVVTTPQRLEAARRSRRVANEDLAYFEEIGRERRQRMAEMNLRRSEQYLANATEELTQLQKMYEADELTEESEEIILKRQRFEVEAAEFNLTNTRIQSERELKTLLPREEEGLRTQKREHDVALQFAEVSLPRALARKQLDLEKMRRDQEKKRLQLADLRADLEAMEVRAPIDGVVFHGANEFGKWTTAAAATKKLVPGGRVAPFEVVMTVVDPGSLRLRAVVPEADLGKLQPGATGKVRPTAFPTLVLETALERVDTLAMPGGGFDAVLTLPNDASARLTPGMSGRVTFVVRAAEAQLLAPSEAVFTEGGETRVYVVPAEGPPERRTVRAGHTDGKRTEILDGLTEGARILLKKPEDEP